MTTTTRRPLTTRGRSCRCRAPPNEKPKARASGTAAFPAQGREVGRRDGRVGRRVPADQARRAGRRGARAEEASQARHAFAVGERVEAHWEEKWWPAVVHGLEDDGSYEVHWDGYGQYDYVAADAVRAVPWSAWGSLGRIFGK